MQVDDIRGQLHQYIDDGDEKLLKLLFAVAKAYDEDEDFTYEFTENDIKELDELRAKRLSGESATYSWEEAKEIITGKKAL